MCSTEMEAPLACAGCCACTPAECQLHETKQMHFCDPKDREHHMCAGHTACATVWVGYRSGCIKHLMYRSYAQHDTLPLEGG